MLVYARGSSNRDGEAKSDADGFFKACSDGDVKHLPLTGSVAWRTVRARAHWVLHPTMDAASDGEVEAVLNRTRTHAE